MSLVSSEVTQQCIVYTTRSTTIIFRNATKKSRRLHGDMVEICWKYRPLIKVTLNMDILGLILVYLIFLTGSKF